MRTLSLLVAVAATLGTACASTLQQLTMDEMIRQSTAIVRAKVLGSHAEARGRDIYTYYKLRVTENLKSAGSQQLDLAVPGGTAAGLRQRVGGAPELNAGGDYVFFLWTSRTGVTQIIGLSQGLFSVMRNHAGDAVLVRPAATETMVDKSGRVVTDQAVTLSLSELKSRIQPLADGKQHK
ncbi:MAG: hypothetical protein ABSB35_28270 [Bryobacteraceae bacterium]